VNVPIKLLPSGLWTRVQAEVAGSYTPGTWATNDWTPGPSAHFQIFANTPWVLVKVVSFTICPSDPFPPASEYFIDNIRLRRSQTPGQIPYPTLGCPGTTTTTTTRTTTTTTGPGSSRRLGCRTRVVTPS
jgi:hypothetical protein